MHHVIQTRNTVRQAVTDGRLPSFEELAKFEWNTIGDFGLLELMYAETWHLMEYITREFGTGSVPRLLAQYQGGSLEPQDPFLPALGLSAGAVWTGFSVDIVADLTEQERLGLGLCSLASLRERSLALGRERNQYVPLVSFEEPRQVSERLRAFSQRWQALLEESSRLEMPAEVSNSRDLLAEHFQAMG